MLYSSYDSCELFGKLGIICHHNHHTIICQNTDTKAVSSLRGYELRLTIVAGVANKDGLKEGSE